MENSYFAASVRTPANHLRRMVLPSIFKAAQNAKEHTTANSVTESLLDLKLVVTQDGWTRRLELAA